MSARKWRLTLKPQAQTDVRGVLLYTHQQWGREQRSRYRARLFEAMHKLVEYPEIGQPRDDLFPGCRGLRAEQHIIFYRIAEGEIIVSRVLHVRRDATGEVEP